ncbi:hypothetical protein DFH08DRAFT_799211 [Mycena albidolilacea]|uniref:Uncharacterized protein n=1 Tax=Mycena albidolilacea TaxID=1033008 RepID=A0AAD7F2Q4_9AGAR|nr:hypothetical protein DFH08DRAFT_799211 [Mycena albidolilacea]
MWRSDVQLILFASLSLIPDNTLRYTALGSAIAPTSVYNIHFSIATWLHRPEKNIQQTEAFIEEVKSKCPWPRDQFRLAEERVRLLDALAAEKPTWKKYWFLKRSVAECANRVKSIRAAVQQLQLVLESEIQQKLNEDIKETRSILTNTWPACAACQGVTTSQINLSGQSVSVYRSAFADNLSTSSSNAPKNSTVSQV